MRVISETKACTLCTRDEQAGRDHFNPQELKTWTLNTPRLLSLFQEAIGIEHPKTDESISGLLWDLGTQEINGASYHLFFCRNIDEIEKSKISIVATLPHSAVFYTGTPHVALPDVVILVPFSDAIKDMKDGCVIANHELLEQYFPRDLYATKEGVTQLDDTMALQDNAILHGRIRGGHFKKSAAIHPLAARIIERLYQIRNYDDHAMTLQELADALESTKVSISNEIKRINELPTEKKILHKYDDQRWGLNPRLSCA